MINSIFFAYFISMTLLKFLIIKDMTELTFEEKIFNSFFGIFTIPLALFSLFKKKLDK